jgi:hypothetical protein
MRVVLQPAGDGDASEHYVDTIENRAAVGRILSNLGPVDRSWRRERIGSQRSLPVWGVTPGKNDINKRKWERIARGGFDWKLTVKARREQRLLRLALTGHCCICGDEFPVDLLVAAHVKKRSHCSHLERKDYKNVVVPMCKLGCDDLYERGYFILGSNGLIRVSKTPVMTAAVQRYASAIASKRCLGWRPESR